MIVMLTLPWAATYLQIASLVQLVVRDMPVYILLTQTHADEAV